MRIGFMGPSGAGKTTLLSAMRRHPHFAEYRFNQNVMADLKAKGHPINEHTRAETQTLAMKEFAYGALCGPKTVNERTVLDCLAYTAMAAQLGNVGKETLCEHANVAWALAPDYDRIFYIAPEFGVKANGVRLTDPEAYRIHVQAFDRLYQQATEACRINRLTGTVAERLAQIEALLDLEGDSLVALAPD